MKTLSILTILIFVSGLSYAQINNDQEVLLEKTNEIEAGEYTTEEIIQKNIETKLVYDNHTFLALKQLNSHIADNIKYPVEMMDSGVEGLVIAELLLSRNGEISDLKIVKGLTPIFNKTVENTFNKFSAISLDNDTYQGSEKLQIPVRFVAP